MSELDPEAIAAQLDDPAAWAVWLAGWRFTSDPQLLALVREGTAPLGEARPEAVIRLSTLGHQAEARERGAWDRATYTPHPTADAKVAAMWARWAQGRFWGDQSAWMKLLWRPVLQSFRHALANRPLPPDVVRRALQDLEEALFFQLVGGGEGAGGFRELAVTTLETAPGGPVMPLLELMSDDERAVVAACITRRGHWPQTVARILPDLPGARERALHLRALPRHHAEAWLDLHVVFRLLSLWAEDAEPCPERDWSVVVQNRGRARGRLRAVATRCEAAQLAAALGGLEQLAERTRAAARRWAWSWAWEALAKGFSFDLGQPVIRPCTTTAGPEPLDQEAHEALRVWALLVVLRGRWATLRRWCHTGEGDGDGTWGRLLGELPADLRDPDGGLTRIRAALAADEALGQALDPILASVAQLSVGRTLKQRFWELVDPTWHDAIRRPRSGFPTFHRNATAWVQRSERSAEVPAPGGGQDT